LSALNWGIFFRFPAPFGKLGKIVIFEGLKMTEQDIYRQFEEALAAFDREGDTPRTRELTRKAIEDAFYA
jgi:hypothetical protein